MAMLADQPTLLVLALPFLAAFLSPLAVRLFAYRAVWLLALFPFAIFLHLAGHAGAVANGEVFTGGISWIPTLGVSLSWRMDGLSLVFGMLISGIGTLIILYSGGYLKGHAALGRFLAFMFLFMGSMLGLVMADNFYALLVLWEMTSVTSFLLIGFDHNRQASRRAAIQALVVTGGGGLMLIAAMIVIQGITGVSELSLLLATGDTLRESPYYVVAFILVLGGAFTKSAQFPLHFWLPNAMEAPTPVSAYLHSATMVKAGVYLLMRMNPVMGETVLWETVLPLFGIATLLAGSLLAIRQTDLKLKLAYTTVASLGLLVMLTGFGGEKAIEAAVYYLVAHSLFKGTLFMVAGTIDHEAGTRDIRKLSGLRAAMPLTFAAALLAALSMGGLPPLFGFLAKEEIYYALAKPGAWAIALTILAIVGNALMLVIGFAVALKPFLGKSRDELHHAHEGPVLLIAGPLVLSVLGLVLALASGFANRILVSPMASSVAGEAVTAVAGVIPHIGLPLALSGLTVLVGIAIYMRLDNARLTMAKLLWRIGWGPDKGFDQAIAGLVRFSVAVTRFIHNGRLETYVTVVFVALAATLLGALAGFGEMPRMPALPGLTFYEWGILAIALAGLMAVIWADNRLTAIVSLGIQGFAVALIFMLFGAPDLSFTQFMVETLSVVILALVMTRLTLHKSDHRPMSQRLVDAAIALTCAAGFGLLLLSVTQLPFNSELSDFFAENSRVIAHGRNIVNVIIVDFRGLDTLGEIAVVMVTGLAILALIRIRHQPHTDEVEDLELTGELPGELKGGRNSAEAVQ
ncbi:MAG: putative monovalent cation/H+ antiporter subunit A [Nitratireductor sp.]